jgi:hypothetical protein
VAPRAVKALAVESAVIGIGAAMITHFSNDQPWWPTALGVGVGWVIFWLLCHWCYLQIKELLT